MNKEQIEQAAKEDILWFAIRRNKDKESLYKAAFIAGAEWRINSVWHDTKDELPEYNKHVVNEDWFDFEAKDEKDLKRILKTYPFKRWAYVEDLLPTKTI